MLNYLHLNMYRHQKVYFLYFFLIITLQFFLTNQIFAFSTNQIDLRQEFGQHKNFVDKVELPALIALSFFPELKSTYITFEYRKIKTTMSTRPHIGQFLLRNRTYVIYINSHAKEIGGVSFDELGLQEQIGIIAHELSHIVDYQNRKSFSMLKCGFYYSFFEKYHRSLERSTDMLVIQKGLAHQLYAFSNYVLNKSSASEEYKDFKRKNYLLPEEIADYL
ncbi:MAG: hypothetical protein ACK45U_10410 [bacterium]|jgi:hypothetical protein